MHIYIICQVRSRPCIDYVPGRDEVGGNARVVLMSVEVDGMTSLCVSCFSGNETVTSIKKEKNELELIIGKTKTVETWDGHNTRSRFQDSRA